MSENLDKMSVIELRQKAKELGVKLGAGINKQGIVDKLKEALAARETPAQPEQEQTTIPVKLYSFIASIIIFFPAWEHIY